MKQYKIVRYIVFAIIGFVIFGTGLVLIKLLPDADGILKTLPYICVGLGSGLLGGNLGTAIKNRAALKNPQIAKQVEIEEKDERNRAISNRAKANAYDLMIYTYSAILLAFALMGVELYVVLTLVAVYLFIISANAYYLNKYHKEM
ncbi:hypothetical protein [Clostridium aminobutyricum]|uniref:DUF2178 domain-containing protein n=1 Tax=Clostridium aminobutyricum TaxID=33953 RepID=A0A939IGM3_CLOAM|nr:hypothetical protein [Clostridium aminobutyricum]MBN7773530.1 hypothetical protein [Clostridium aminobutyricum]